MDREEFLDILKNFLGYLENYDISIRKVDYEDYYQSSYRIDEDDLREYFIEFDGVSLKQRDD